MSTTAGLIMVSSEALKKNDLEEFFKKKSALSPETACDVSDEEIKEHSKRISKKDLYKYNFIKQVDGSEKFYLDEKSLERDRNILKVVFVVSFGIAALIVLYVKLTS